MDITRSEPGLALREEVGRRRALVEERAVDGGVVGGGDLAVVVEVPVGPVDAGAGLGGGGAVEGGVIVGVHPPVEVQVAGEGESDEGFAPEAIDAGAPEEPVAAAAEAGEEG